jgi:hypothetical protein
LGGRAKVMGVATTLPFLSENVSLVESFAHRGEIGGGLGLAIAHLTASSN